jgi:hypothetical protein
MAVLREHRLPATATGVGLSQLQTWLDEMEGRPAIPDAEAHSFGQLLGRFATSDLAESRSILEHNPGLLSPFADAVFEEIVFSQTNPELVERLRKHQQLLRLAGQIGIEQAFALYTR